MAEYPRTVLEFRDWFADDEACRDYLAKLRWPAMCRGLSLLKFVGQRVLGLGVAG